MTHHSGYRPGVGDDPGYPGGDSESADESNCVFHWRGFCGPGAKSAGGLCRLSGWYGGQHEGCDAGCQGNAKTAIAVR